MTRHFGKALAAGLLFLCAYDNVSHAFEPYGEIGKKWRQLGAAGGPLGVARSDERDAARGGRFNQFQNGFIYWHPKFGAHAVYGLIGQKWDQLGRETGIGYPLTDEQPAAGGGRFNDFEDGKSISWSWRTGAHLVYGSIRVEWIKRGREGGACGYPTSDEIADGNFRRSNFEKGFIRWSARTGAVARCAVKIDDGTALNPVKE